MMIAVASNVTGKAFFAFMAFLLLAGACGGIEERTGGGVDPCANMACRPTLTITWTASMGRRPIDLLLVVDDRVPTGPASAAFAKAMNDLAANTQLLLEMDRWASDIHIALVPANLAPDTSPSQLWPTSQACPLPAGPYVQLSELCDSPINFYGSLADLLACATTHLPTSGLPSRPLDTARALLSPKGLALATGFRRSNGELLLAIVTSEDDPTAAEPGGRKGFVDLVNGLDPDQSLFQMAVAAPADATGFAELAKALYLLGPDNIADAQWPSIGYIADTHRDWTTKLCLDIVDPNQFLQREQPPLPCTFVERITKTGGETSERPLAECPADTTPAEPCWRAGIDTLRCPVSGVYLEYVEPHQVCRTGDHVTVTATCATPYQPAHPLGSEVSP
jgi:hypothetical protein